MKLVAFEQNRMQMLGVFDNSGRNIYPLGQFGIQEVSLNILIKNMSENEWNELEERIKVKAASGQVEQVSLETVKLMAPIPEPAQDIICLGINYMDHAEESARYKKESFDGTRDFPVYFSKRVNQAVAHDTQISYRSDIVDSLDYEVELAVIIGKDAKNVAKEDVYDYVFGYTIINDMSARNIQTRHKQWYLGKSMDDFTPMGPCIVTKNEFSIPPSLDLSSKVNGELRQNSNTDLLIFSIEYVIEELSQVMTLKAGTIISMGTPAGVGMGFVPPKFLKSGDIVECQIEGIGILRNRIEEKQ